LGPLPVEHLTADLQKRSDSPVVSVSDLRCAFAGGDLAGRIDWSWPAEGPARYATSVVLRDADVTRLMSEAGAQIKGQMTASLAVEGAWNDPGSRRGRGDVLVEGDELYRVPLLLGLLQVTNLSLPINSPFNRASVRYGVEGDRVTIEAIELAASQMKMTGDGYLDFADKRVFLNLATDSTNWLKVPVLEDLLRGARKELLQIRVRGSIQDPQFSAGSLPTITTTIDEVFKR
ncbi:MAG: AsmA-like C-terminal region-containing protein, partial [Phycisphaerae bacterium]|nr:AsmA-like C-terminal region-containing protein [Phycisphaerae bacterium]